MLDQINLLIQVLLNRPYDRRQLAKKRQDRLQKIIAHAFSEVPYYRKLSHSTGGLSRISRFIVTATELLTPRMRRVIGDAFHCPVYECYYDLLLMSNFVSCVILSFIGKKGAAECS